MLIGGPAKKARVPKARKKPVSLPAYPTPKPAARPTPQQIRTAKAIERSYKSQGTAVKRAATDQRTGLTREQRTRKPQKVSGGRAPQERYYRSQGRSVERQASRQRTGLTSAQLKTLTKPQRKSAITGYKAGRAYAYTPKVTKHNVMPVPKELKKAKELGYLETDPDKLEKMGFAAPGALEEFVSSPKYAIKAISNIPKDVKELAITTPSSIAHAAVQQAKAAQHLSKGDVKSAFKIEKKLAKETVQPYGELAKDPVKFFTERPVTTGLMVLPAGRLAKLGGGRIARVSGKQTLARPTAALPGTSMKQARIGSRTVTGRAQQERKDVEHGTPTVSNKEISRRVDERYDVGQQHKQAATASEARKINEELKQLPRAERKQVKRESRKRAEQERQARAREAADKTPEPVKEGPKTKAAALAEEYDRRLSGARAGAGQHVDREFAREFGSNWRVGEGGAILKPKKAPEHSGVIHATREEAQKIVARLEADKAVTWKPHVMEIEGDTPGVTSGYAVVPKAAAQRFQHHKRVGKSPATGSVVMRVGSRQFRKTVLPLSVPWLLGQVSEGAIRSAAMGAGPLSVHRFNKTIKELRKIDPDKAKELEQRVISGGQFGVTGPAAEFAGKSRTIGEEFAPTGLAGPAAAISKAAAAPGLRAGPKAYRAYTNVVFNHVNGRVEQLAKKAMAGKALKQGPLMDKRLITLSDKAAKEAAEGLKNTSAQVNLAREVDRAYGKYSKLGPHAREVILHSTPFVPWLMNMAQFVFRVLPVDHPAKTALLTSYTEADREWRMRNRLSYYGKDRVPDWMMGAYPTKGGKYVRAGRYMPFAPGEYVGTLGSQILPQFSGSLLNLAGVDWKGEKIEPPKGHENLQEWIAANAALSQAEAMVPLAGQLNRATGLGERYVRGKKDKESIIQGKSVPQGLLDLVNPVKPIGAGSGKKKKGKAKTGLSGGLGGGLKGGLSGGLD